MNKAKGNNTGLIIGIVAAVAVVGITILVLCLTGVLGGGSYPKDIASFQKAIEAKSAVNCEITTTEEAGTMTIQANEGWTKLRMFGEIEGSEMNILAIKDDATYTIMGGMAVKTAFDNSMIDEFTSSVSEEATSEDEAATTIKCSSPSKSDFSIPDKDWMDMTGFDDTDY